MKEVKMPTSDSWLDALIESLKDPEEAAGYLSVALEPEDPEPKLLRAVLQDAIDARFKMNNLSDKAKLYHQQLDKILLENGGKEIYTLVSLLDELGFRIEVKIKDNIDNQHL
ncbi:DNA-binding protein [Argonema galeatum]|uniref:helix-turn-helix domain-containing transcriptional regulator n=1 Tax=Argonema galeatum TaxID=2942762 RepID=UPI0020131EBF|nr:transcriptional regulator [Argonema galeatum]MCL1467985.1 transcriptional regulator [Argonema galeatum A003/A1]